MEDMASKGSIDRGGASAAEPVAEETLLRLYANGDAEAARELVGLLGPRAYSVALRVLGNRAEAEDVTQEAMLRLWRIAPEWQSGRAKVSTWLYRVVMNLCLDLRRRTQTLDLDGIPEPEDGSPAAMEQLLHVARVDALQDALMRLPVRQRQAVVLRHIEELSNPEIAGIMEIGVEAVESLTARGKRTLAAVLADRKDELGYQDGG
ncbi:RNA polymerase sigma factor [Ruegeria sp. PrR005]|uniref:RNA polymerase sigma factor n=2 Tax=Ruegeria sp. PrR005 TaxID=2706882 RepID=A0A6B2NMV2_9RHOB|nr:RNA polymerase sigma factor [Ruegeria sp. PrR005]NDW44698.1 RNA polymerase sigma factor [Ruegeria sp. PrR005]